LSAFNISGSVPHYSHHHPHRNYCVKKEPLAALTEAESDDLQGHLLGLTLLQGESIWTPFSMLVVAMLKLAEREEMGIGRGRRLGLILAETWESEDERCELLIWC
jgi:hypothetical protein